MVAYCHAKPEPFAFEEKIVQGLEQIRSCSTFERAVGEWDMLTDARQGEPLVYYVAHEAS